MDERLRQSRTNRLRQRRDGRFLGVAEIDRSRRRIVERHIGEQPVHQVVHIAEGPGLPAVAGQCEGPAEQRLDDEIGHHAPIGRVHPGAVGVEDARDPDIDAVLAVVVEKQRLGAALAFVIAGAGADRVHIAPVVLLLRVGQRVAIHLAGRGLENARAAAPGEIEHVDGAVHGGLHGLHGVVLVVDRARRAGEVEDAVHLQAQRLRHIVADELEIRLAQKMGDIRLGAGEQVVEADDIRALGHQAFAKMRTDESRPSGNEHAVGVMLHPSVAAFPRMGV